MFFILTRNNPVWFKTIIQTLFSSILTEKFADRTKTIDTNGKLCVFLIHLVLLKQTPTYGHFIPYGYFPLWTLFHMDILPYGQFADSPT